MMMRKDGLPTCRDDDYCVRLASAVQRMILTDAGRYRIPGIFDSEGCWYPVKGERRECCDMVERPTKSHPYTLRSHCNSFQHIAKRYNVKEEDLRKEVYKVVSMQNAKRDKNELDSLAIQLSKYAEMRADRESRKQSKEGKGCSLYALRWRILESKRRIYRALFGKRDPRGLFSI